MKRFKRKKKINSVIIEETAGQFGRSVPAWNLLCARPP